MESASEKNIKLDKDTFTEDKQAGPKFQGVNHVHKLER